MISPAAQPKPPPWLAEARIGVICREKRRGRQLARLLDESGYRQSVALDSAEAARQAEGASPFDLLLCEADEPAGIQEAAAPEPLALARKLGAACGAIAITAREDARWILRCLKEGAATCHLESDGDEALLELVFEQLRQGDQRRDERGRRKARMRQRLAAAIRSGAIEMHYQPIIETRDGRVARVEALARWTDQEFGYVIPSDFVRAAEREGLADELGRLALRKSIATLQRLRQKGLFIACSVNVSRKQFENPRLAEDYRQIAREMGEPPENIAFEVTETARYRDEALARSLMTALREAGFGLSIDDFGAGESSFAQLANPAYREIKVDRSLVALIHDPIGESVLRSVLRLAKALGLTLVAEGVETAETAQALADLGVDYCPGYFFSRPLPEGALEAFLLKGREGAGDEADKEAPSP